MIRYQFSQIQLAYCVAFVQVPFPFNTVKAKMLHTLYFLRQGMPVGMLLCDYLGIKSSELFCVDVYKICQLQLNLPPFLIHQHHVIN